MYDPRLIREASASGGVSRRFLLPALAGPLQMLPLSDLTRKSLTALALRRAAEKGRLQTQRRATGWYSTRIWVDRYARSRRSRGSPG